jgi:mono/diheme cytochrome c family protein
VSAVPAPGSREPSTARGCGHPAAIPDAANVKRKPPTQSTLFTGLENHLTYQLSLGISVQRGASDVYQCNSNFNPCPDERYRIQSRNLVARLSLVVLAVSFLAMPLRKAAAADAQVARGKYLVTLGGCSDCHTPGTFFGKPDMTKYLGGSDVGFAIPGLGVFAGPNLTPDKATGLGNWTTPQVVAVLTTGKRPDGRILAPIMPWQAFSLLAKSDALAIVAYLKSLPAVNNKVGGPFGPNEKPTIFVMSVQPGDVYSGLPKPPAPPAK